jgi:peptidoglycan/LPS O-acetylase OafA/YrhL
LTSLRFFAALGVVLCHLGLITQGSPQEALTRSGYVGVTFFFILSGFVLTWSWQSVPAVRFYARRLARIWPLHAVTWTLTLTFFVDRRGSLGQMYSGLGLVQMLPLPWSWMPDPRVVEIGNGVAWTLSCELAFYLVLPVLTPLVLRATQPVLIGLLIFTVTLPHILTGAAQTLSPRHAEDWLLLSPAYRFHEFLLGVVIAALARKGLQARVSLRTCALVVAVTYVAVSTEEIWAPGSRANGAMLLPFALLIAATAAHDLQGHRGLLARAWLVDRGNASFALYLVHFPIVLTFADLATGRPIGVRLGFAAVALLLSLLTAEVAHRYLERPVEQVLRAAIDGRGSAHAIAGAPRRVGGGRQ